MLRKMILSEQVLLMPLCLVWFIFSTLQLEQETLEIEAWLLDAKQRPQPMGYHYNHCISEDKQLRRTCTFIIQCIWFPPRSSRVIWTRRHWKPPRRARSAQIQAIHGSWKAVWSYFFRRLLGVRFVSLMDEVLARAVTGEPYSLHHATRHLYDVSC